MRLNRKEWILNICKILQQCHSVQKFDEYYRIILLSANNRMIASELRSTQICGSAVDNCEFGLSLSLSGRGRLLDEETA